MGRVQKPQRTCDRHVYSLKEEVTQLNRVIEATGDKLNYKKVTRKHREDEVKNEIL